MKKSIITLASLFLILTSFAAGPSEKVLQVFNATFSNPEKVTWYDSEDYYQAYFTQGGVNTRVKYDKKGNFVSAIRYYKEQYLPIHIVNQIKKDYPGKQVYGVSEVTNGETVNYFINLQDDKNWTMIQLLASGETVKAQTLKKG